MFQQEDVPSIYTRNDRLSEEHLKTKLASVATERKVLKRKVHACSRKQVIKND